MACRILTILLLSRVSPFLKVVLIAVLGTYFHTGHFNTSKEVLPNEEDAWREIGKIPPLCCLIYRSNVSRKCDPQKIFKSLALNGDIYGEIAYDASMIYRDITLLGYDLVTAMTMSRSKSGCIHMDD